MNFGKKRAAFELILAGALWGFGFIAATWAIQSFTPTETLVLRFITASVLGEALYFILRRPKVPSAKSDFLKALPAGALLGGMLLLQTIGLKYTTATKSGFLTSIYVILVPLLNTLFFKTASSWKNYALAILALFGTFILMDAKIHDVNAGDLWTLACSLIAALHIIYIGKVSNSVGNSFRFNNFQSIWALLILTPLLLTQEKVTLHQASGISWLGVLILGMGASLIAFSIQIRAQKVLSDSTASMIFLLESPFAALFGFLLLNERLTFFQGFGAIIILTASAMQILWDPSSKSTKTQPR